MNQLSHQHGGDLDAIERIYHIPKKEILDFSGNINPLGFPVNVQKALSENIRIVTTYPDKNYIALKEAISRYTGASPNHIVVGNGSTELISTFIRSSGAKKTLIIGPAYSEYEREVAVSGGEFSYFPLEEKNDFLLDLQALFHAFTADIGLLIICNPNNPTGSAITAKQMREILLYCKNNHTSVMVDETYIEFSDNLEEICSIPLAEEFDNLFVIRGISKFFAAPGIRLGYGISSNPHFLEMLQACQDPWSVNILASFAGERLFCEHQFIEDTKRLIHLERKKALEELATWKNSKAYPTWSNFILIKLVHSRLCSEEIFDSLIRQKLLIRNAESFTFLNSEYLRFCLRLPEENQLLLTQLKQLIEGKE